jgi:hypothetical protein
MNPRRIWAVIYRHGCEARRNLSRITDTVYWPVQNIILWGFFTLYLSREHRLEPGVVSYLLGATMLWGMFYSFQRDLATGFMEELWSRNLLNLFCTPLNVSEYVTGLILLTLLKALLGLLLALLIAWLCYAENLFPALPGFVPFSFHSHRLFPLHRLGHHGTDHPLHHEDSDPGLELRGPAHASLLCVLSLDYPARLAPSARLGSANHARL